MNSLTLYNQGDRAAMSSLYTERDGDKEFTSCCGASAKGCDGYLGCRVCYQEIWDILSDKEAFRKLIGNKTLLAEFNTYVK